MLNQKTILKWYVVNDNFLKIPGKFYCIRYLLPFKQLKKARFQPKTFLKKLKLQFTFFFQVLRLISIITGKLSQQLAVSCILFKIKIG